MKRSRLVASLSIATFVVGIAEPASAEVSDKIVSVPTMCTWILATSIAGFLVWRWGGLVAFLVTPFLFFPGLAFLSEVYDPHVGPAIWQEQGFAYVLTAHGAPVFVTLSAFLGRRSRARAKSSIP